MSRLIRLGVALASALKALDARLPVVERWLDLPLTDHDIQLVRESCAGVRLGAYYHWYLQKLVVARAINDLDRAKAIDLIQSIDHTDYRRSSRILASGTGVVVAIPHHAHYILSMTALAAHLGKHRKVNVFYGQPATHKGNAIFDHLQHVLFSDPQSGVDVIHDTRQGLARAIKGLRNGEVVFIMPDAFQNEDATMMVPFCGRLMNTMLGTAMLARKTGTWVLPVVSRIHGSGLGFRTWFGERIDSQGEADSQLTVEQTRIADYGVIRRMFRQMEDQMASELYLWQNVRAHMALGLKTNLVRSNSLASLADALVRNPLFKAPDLVLDLRQAGTV